MKTVSIPILGAFLLSSVNAFAVPADQLPEGGWENVSWKHANVSEWDVTATLKSVYIEGSHITFPYNGGLWPVTIVFETALAGNCWAMINYEEQWVAFTFDFLRLGQYSKETKAVWEAAHEAGLNWYPEDGEEMYVWISGLARTSDRNAYERSNTIRYNWNQGTGTPDPEPPEPPECPEPVIIKPVILLNSKNDCSEEE